MPGEKGIKLRMLLEEAKADRKKMKSRREETKAYPEKREANPE
jgi:hypothetical protein